MKMLSKILEIFLRLLPNILSYATLVIGIVGGALAIVLADYLRRSLFKPKLALEYENNEDYKPKTPFKNDQDETEGYDIRVRITNRSRFVARDCRVYLINVEKKDQKGEFVRTVYCDSIPLAWSCQEKHKRYSGYDIHHGVNQYVDIIVTKKDSNEFCPQIMVLPYRYSDLFKKKGVFRFTIQAAAAGADPVTIKLIFDWKGVWDDFMVNKG